MSNDTSPPSPTTVLGSTVGPLMRRFIPEGADPAIIPAAAFRPTPSDTTGISVSLHHLPNPIQRVLTGTRNPPESYSVCLFTLEGEVLADLMVDLSPTLADPGHATIPEISPPYADLSNGNDRKKHIRKLMALLSKRARTIHCAGEPIPPAE